VLIADEGSFRSWRRDVEVDAAAKRAEALVNATALAIAFFKQRLERDPCREAHDKAHDLVREFPSIRRTFGPANLTAEDIDMIYAKADE
jgi:hypothetical protein